jgi:hypothetical protein
MGQNNAFSSCVRDSPRFSSFPRQYTATTQPLFFKRVVRHPLRWEEPQSFDGHDWMPWRKLDRLLLVSFCFSFSASSFPSPMRWYRFPLISPPLDLTGNWLNSIEWKCDGIQNLRGKYEISLTRYCSGKSFRFSFPFSHSFLDRTWGSEGLKKEAV